MPSAGGAGRQRHGGKDLAERRLDAAEQERRELARTVERLRTQGVACAGGDHTGRREGPLTAGAGSGKEHWSAASRKILRLLDAYLTAKV